MRDSRLTKHILEEQGYLLLASGTRLPNGTGLHGSPDRMTPLVIVGPSMEKEWRAQARAYGLTREAGQRYFYRAERVRAEAAKPVEAIQ